MSLVSAQHLVKTYQMGDVKVSAIKGVDFEIKPSSFVSFVGPSCSGKSTLLNMIGCLDYPTDGILIVLGQDVARLDRNPPTVFRGKHIGIVFQGCNLIPVLTTYANIMTEESYLHKHHLILELAIDA